ncbi:MAG: hypothetical protein GX099_08865 [Clostridiaceae bacterium]|nr:hypothetical protein [Clostridiaceae bacterium]
MSFILRNIRRMSFSHWKSNLLIFIEMAVCTAIFFVMLHNYSLARFSYNDRLSDTVRAERFTISLQDIAKAGELFPQTTIYDVALKVQKDILESPDWVAYERGSLTFIPYTHDGFPSAIPKEMMAKDIISDFNDQFLAVQIILSPTYMTQNGLRVTEGRTFEEADFHVFDGPTPVIIGAQLAPYLHVGDVITYGDHWDENTIIESQAVVIGILEEDSFTVFQEGDFDINKGILSAGPMPFYGEDSLEFLERDRLSGLLNGGVIVPHDKNLDVQDKVNQITAKYGFYSMIVQPLDMNTIMDATVVSQKNLVLLSVLAILTSSLAVLSVGTVLMRRTRKDIPNICTFLMSGIPLGKIMTSILIDLLFWGSFSLLPALWLSWTEYGMFMIPIWQLLLFHYGVLLIAYIPIIPTLGRINLDYNIRAGGE